MVTENSLREAACESKSFELQQAAFEKWWHGTGAGRSGVFSDQGKRLCALGFAQGYLTRAAQDIEAKSELPPQDELEGV